MDNLFATLTSFIRRHPWLTLAILLMYWLLPWGYFGNVLAGLVYGKQGPPSWWAKVFGPWRWLIALLLFAFYPVGAAILLVWFLLDLIWPGRESPLPALKVTTTTVTSGTTPAPAPGEVAGAPSGSVSDWNVFANADYWTAQLMQAIAIIGLALPVACFGQASVMPTPSQQYDIRRTFPTNAAATGLIIQHSPDLKTWSNVKPDGSCVWTNTLDGGTNVLRDPSLFANTNDGYYYCTFTHSMGATKYIGLVRSWNLLDWSPVIGVQGTNNGLISIGWTNAETLYAPQFFYESNVVWIFLTYNWSEGNLLALRSADTFLQNWSIVTNRMIVGYYDYMLAKIGSTYLCFASGPVDQGYVWTNSVLIGNWGSPCAPIPASSLEGPFLLPVFNGFRLYSCENGSGAYRDGSNPTNWTVNFTPVTEYPSITIGHGDVIRLNAAQRQNFLISLSMSTAPGFTNLATYMKKANDLSTNQGLSFPKLTNAAVWGLWDDHVPLTIIPPASLGTNRFQVCNANSNDVAGVDQWGGFFAKDYGLNSNFWSFFRFESTTPDSWVDYFGRWAGRFNSTVFCGLASALTNADSYPLASTSQATNIAAYQAANPTNVNASGLFTNDHAYAAHNAQLMLTTNGQPVLVVTNGQVSVGQMPDSTYGLTVKNGLNVVTGNLVVNSGTLYIDTISPAVGFSSMFRLTNSAPPATASTIGAMYFWNSNGTALFILISSRTSTAWTATNLITHNP